MKVIREQDKKPGKKDMHLPTWLLAFGICMITVGAGAAAFGIARPDDLPPPLWGLILAVCAGLGGAAVLCWKNQGIQMPDDRTFIYTTMFGRTRRYRFDQIDGVTFREDDLTLFADGDKIHVESCAVVTDRLLAALEASIARTQRQ